MGPGISTGWMYSCPLHLLPGLHTPRFFLNLCQSLHLTLHALGGVQLLLVAKGCLAGWVWREPRADSYLTFPGRGKNESRIVLANEGQLALSLINSQEGQPLGEGNRAASMSLSLRSYLEVPGVLGRQDVRWKIGCF